VIDIENLDGETRRLLDRYGFEHVPFSELARRLREQGLDPARDRLRVPVALPPAGALAPLPEPGTPEHDRLAALGRRAIDAGQVGAVVLNGGMATRFGGTAKGVVPAVAGRSFLDLKLSQIGRAGGGRAPALLMNSFATDRITASHLAGLDPGCEVRSFTQMISLRLAPDGGLFLGADGRPSLHAPGHGDLPFALRASGELERFLAAGGRFLTMSNVDNLGAALDPAVIGRHIDGGRPVTVELVDTDPGDVGGFPALVEGRLTIVEAFRLPLDFDVTTIPVFNTNTFVFDARALESAPDLQWFSVVKTVEGREAVQFERLVGQLTDFFDTTWLRVPRRGPASRFLPIKVPSDLVDRARDLEQALAFQGVLG
jgi:UTP--glucose-1-phosphate uridylyltransferase